ncbi:MAG: SPFH domain-containing protein [Planctomycetota bacterium]
MRFSFLSKRFYSFTLGIIISSAAIGGGIVAYKRIDFGETFPRVPAGHVGILLRKSGRTPPPGQLVSPRLKPGELPYQGVQEEVLQPGWYATGYSASEFDWWYIKQTTIPADHVGVLVREFGEDLPDNQILADENPQDEAKGIIRRGPLKRPLQAGTYPINTYAYSVRVFEAKTIEPGQVGITCKRFGALPKDTRSFLSETNERGVQKQGLAPGTYSINPFAEEVRTVSRQSKKLDLGLAGRVKFPSNDGFDISLNGTVEWSLTDKDVPLVYVKFGDTAGAEKKLLLPAARAKSRLQGSKKPAREFISGNTRQTFQDDFAKDLRAFVEPEGIRVHSVLISGIQPPDEIAKPIRDREISLLDREQYQKQMNTERGRAEFASQSELQKRPEIMAGAKVKTIELTTKAKREQEVELIRAQSNLDVARLELQAAEKQAEGIDAIGMADSDVMRFKIDAETAALKGRVDAHGGGAAYARTILVQRIVPKITSIFTHSEGPAISLLRDFLTMENNNKPNTSNAVAAEVR